MNKTLEVWMGVIGLALAVWLLLFSEEANPADLYVQFPLISKHYNAGDWNEVNPGAIIEIGSEAKSFLIGGYKNSLNQSTFLVGGELQSGYVGVQLGLATGYKEITGMQIAPIGTIFAEAGTEKIRLRLSAIPHKNGAIALSLIIKGN